MAPEDAVDADGGPKTHGTNGLHSNGSASGVDTPSNRRGHAARSTPLRSGVDPALANSGCVPRALPPSAAPFAGPAQPPQMGARADSSGSSDGPRRPPVRVPRQAAILLSPVRAHRWLAQVARQGTRGRNGVADAAGRELAALRRARGDQERQGRGAQTRQRLRVVVARGSVNHRHPVGALPPRRAVLP